MLLLKWKEKSELLKNEYRELRTQYFGDERKFVAVLFFGKSNAFYTFFFRLTKKRTDYSLFIAIFYNVSLAAFCSASFLEGPRPLPYTIPSIFASTVNILSWAGPSSFITSYSTDFWEVWTISCKLLL